MSKHFAGIDIGSCSIELVLVDDSGKIVLSLQTDTNFDPMLEARKLLNGVSYDRIMATTLGYDIEEFGKESLLAEKDLNISSMCTVKRYCTGKSSNDRGIGRSAFSCWLNENPIYRIVNPHPDFPLSGYNIRTFRSGTEYGI